MEEQILLHIHSSLKEFAQVYAQAMDPKPCTFFRDEESVKLYLHGLFFKMPELTEFKEYGGPNNKNVLLHCEVDTKDGKGRLDFGVWSPRSAVSDNLFLAGEIKCWVDFNEVRVKERIAHDIQKLLDEDAENSVFIFVDKDKFNQNLSDYFNGISKLGVMVYWIRPDGMTIFSDRKNGS